ncbi:MAG: putative phage abortive infection protein [Erythrobacter sp.]
MKALIKELWFEAALVVAGLLVIALGLGGFFLAAHLGPSEGRAQIGDFVGGTTTPILTAITFIGVLVGIALQRRELIATRGELELTRQETANSAKALKDQADAIKIQNFERTLFESLSFLNSISEGLRITQYDGTRTLEGRECFHQFHRSLWNGLRHAEYGAYNTETILEEGLLADQMRSISPKLASYYRTLFNIYRYIDDSEFRDNIFYGRIVRAQLDEFFLAILFYNALTERGSRFQRYIIAYDILDNLRPELLAHRSHEHLLEALQPPDGEEQEEAPL